ncbi:MAG: phenylalanine--tRNA ligase subunit beta [Clostridia bacterium]|nr:phenylalanine--tRNA ligase subunit beta [Clostridia bacterium]
MKVQLSWIKDFVDIDVTPKQFAEDITMSGTMVESVEQQGEDIINVVVGKILKIEKHPDADKLVVCQVDVGEEVVQIVTGATNVFEGAVIPVAKDNSTLPVGKIKKGKLRGVESCGMLCSEEELGIATKPAEGILILDDSYTIGMDIREALHLNECIAEFEITSNRPDCLSVIGLAREVAATYNKPLKLAEPQVKECGGDINSFAKVTVLDKDLCLRYTARGVKNVKIAPSPDWLKTRLENAGVRSINNIVDITNYVMLEYGQPMHAFDMRNVCGNEIVVRRAKDGEKITTLDEIDRDLDSNMLVIADGEKAVAVAGVMGGFNSEIKDDTTEILFESATFLGSSVRKTAKKLGLRTESSARFEKGLDPHNTLNAINRACELIELLGAGEVISGVIDVYDKLPENNVIKFRPEKINEFLGTDISKEEMVNTFETLEIKVDGDNLIIPTFRGDIEGEADVAEEVARIYGYNNIPSTLIKGEAIVGEKNDKQKTLDKVMDTFSAMGFYESITLSFNSPKIYEKLNIEPQSYVKISNPLGEDQSIMRTTVIGSMLDTVAVNYNYRNEEAYLYEIGTKYLKVEGSELADEKQEIVAAMYGKNVNYYTAKGVLEKLFEQFGISYYEIERETENNIFHPGQAAKIMLKRKHCATVGRVHPKVLDNFGINVPVYMVVIDFEAIMENKKTAKSYKQLPKFPAVTRDIAMIVDEEVTVREIEDIIRRTKTNIIESWKLFDVYRSEQIGAGKKSIAYSIVFRSMDKTLTDDDVNPVMDNILNQLSEKFGAELRKM